MKAARRFLALLIILTSLAPMAHAQVLVKEQTIDPQDLPAFIQSHGITYKNKPNGAMYRLRSDVQCPDLPLTDAVAGLEMMISEPAGDGYYALFRAPLAADDYRFVVLTYNKKKKVSATYDLCALTGVSNCELQDIRWFDNHLYFNMACPTYSSSLRGRGSKLFDLDLSNGKIVWSSKYLASNDIFIVDKDFVYCGYGFTGEDDFIYLLDRNYGTVLTTCPIHSGHEYIEFIGDRKIFVQDYEGYGYVFRVEEKGVRVTGAGVRLRQGPTTSSEILTNENGKTVYPLKGDVLPTWGDEGDFFKVVYNNDYVYISRLYATTDVMPQYDSWDRSDAGVRAWLGPDDEVVHLEVYDAEKFTASTQISPDELRLTPGTTYDLTIDSPLASGVFLAPCFERWGLYVMSEDCRAFGFDLTTAAATGRFTMVEFGSDYLADDIPFAVDGFEGIIERGDDGASYSFVFALGDGLRSVSPLYFDGNDYGDVDEDGDYIPDSDFEEVEVTNQRFDVTGKLVDEKGNKTAVTLNIEAHDDGLAGGTITYHLKNGKTSVIRLLGTATTVYDDAKGFYTDHLQLTEYLSGSGQRCGDMELVVLADSIVSGTWTMDDRRLTLAVDQQKATPFMSRSEWSLFFLPADDDDLGEEYVWSRKVEGHPVLKEYTGLVNLSFEDDKVTFHCKSVTPNVAECETTEVINDAKTFYFMLPDCEEVMMRIRIFPEALYIDTSNEVPDSECFGMDATLKGWYLKKK